MGTLNMDKSGAFNRLDIERYVVFGFGVIFLAAILTLLVINPKPTLAQFFGFRLTLGLAAAGVGAFIPGFIHYEQQLPHKGLLRCGGAVALFAAVWFTNPARYVIDELAPPPKEDAKEYIENFIKINDGTDYALGYSLLSNREKASISFSSFKQLVGNVRTPLGTRVAGPALWITSSPDEIPGRKGPFVFNTYQSTFSGKPGVWVEVAGVVAEEGRWKLYAYTISPCIAPICQPLDQLKSSLLTD